MYVHQPFPSWRYHATAEPRLVASAEESKALGPGWQRLPVEPKAAQPEVTPKPEEKPKKGK